MTATRFNQGRSSLVFAGAFAGSLVLAATAKAEDLSGAALVGLLQQGGYVIVMRHGSSPPTPPTADKADPENAGRERQLDVAGRESARAMGVALKALHIPVGEVWSSPTYRALQTIRLAGLPQPQTAAEIGDGGQSMAATSAGDAAWLRAKAEQPPRPGTDTLIVTHLPNITAAFGKAADARSDGEAIVFRPGEAPVVIGRIGIEEWPRLAEGK